MNKSNQRRDLEQRLREKRERDVPRNCCDGEELLGCRKRRKQRAVVINNYFGGKTVTEEEEDRRWISAPPDLSRSKG